MTDDQKSALNEIYENLELMQEGLSNVIGTEPYLIEIAKMQRTIGPWIGRSKWSDDL